VVVLDVDSIRERLCAVECLCIADSSVIDCGTGVGLGTIVVCMRGMLGSEPATGARLCNDGGKRGIFSGPSSGYRL
jgi:hypothetical protein